jgi:hypothetical protein
MSPEELIVEHIKLRMSGGEFDSQLLPEIADVYKESIIEQTKNQQDPSGKGWKELSTKYAKYKNNKVNKTEADLRFKFYGSDEGAFEVFDYSIEDDNVKFGFADGEGYMTDYMQAHNEGTGNNLPQRRFIPDDNDAESNVQKINLEKVAKLTAEFLNASTDIEGGQIIINV